MKLKGLITAIVCCLLTSNAMAATLLVVGDSISAAFGLETQQGWVSLLETRLHERAPEWRVVNASRSGETSSGGLARLPALLAKHQPHMVVIELGGNDGLRGQDPALLRANLRQMIEQSQQAGAKVVLLGMRLPPSYGERYTQAFAAVFHELAAQTPTVPFLLDGVGGVPTLMQADGIHPNADAQAQLLENAWPVLAPLL